MSTAFCTTASRWAFRTAAPLAFAALAAASGAQQADIAARLSALSLSALEDAPKPWHLKMSLTLYDEKGAPSQEGTLERWQAGSEARTTVVLGANTTTEYVHLNKRYVSVAGVPRPSVVEDVLDSVLHPGPTSMELAGAQPEVRPQTLGATKLDCYMLSRPLASIPGKLPDPVPLGLFATYCTLPQSDHLELAYSLGNPTVLRTSIGKFQDREVTNGVSIRYGHTLVATGKVDTLATFEPTENEFIPPADLKMIGAPVARIASGLVAGFRKGGAPPAYPVSARQDHISGSVVLRAVIGADGHIHHLNVMSAPTPDMAISALAAVHTWTYKPYLLNGYPVAIDTTVTVNYDLR